MRNWLLSLMPVVLGVGLLLLAVVAIGRATRGQISHQDRYALDFLDIACAAPPGEERADFLSEVQYLANLPTRLHLLDNDLSPRLAAAFARHPWVEKVERVELKAPRQVHVCLTFRKPVLQVTQDRQTRAVDRHGILLPKTALTVGLPLYRGIVRAPAGPAGTRWGDVAIEEAAMAAGRSVAP